MKIDGSDSINAFNSAGWKKMADKAGISWPRLKDRMQSISSDALNHIENIELLDPAVVKPLVERTGERAKRILTMVAN